MAAKKLEQHPVGPVLRVAPLGELKVYTVTEEELDAIGRGSAGSIFLNFALALLPLSGGFLITLLTTKIEGVATLVFFTVACVGCFLAGAICAALAWHFHRSTSTVIEKIKNRMPPPPPISQEAQDAGRGTDRAWVTKEAEAGPGRETKGPEQQAPTTSTEAAPPPAGAPPAQEGPPGAQSGGA